MNGRGWAEVGRAVWDTKELEGWRGTGARSMRAWMERERRRGGPSVSFMQRAGAASALVQRDLAPMLGVDPAALESLSLPAVEELGRLWRREPQAVRGWLDAMGRGEKTHRDLALHNRDPAARAADGSIGQTPAFDESLRSLRENRGWADAGRKVGEARAKRFWRAHGERSMDAWLKRVAEAGGPGRGFLRRAEAAVEFVWPCLAPLMDGDMRLAESLSLASLAEVERLRRQAPDRVRAWCRALARGERGRADLAAYNAAREGGDALAARLLDVPARTVVPEPSPDSVRMIARDLREGAARWRSLGLQGPGGCLESCSDALERAASGAERWER